MTYNKETDTYKERLSLDDVSDHAAMGYDAAPRVSVQRRYLMTERPFSIGCQPKDGLVKYAESDRPKAESGYYGILTYNRALTVDEVQKYELVEV